MGYPIPQLAASTGKRKGYQMNSVKLQLDAWGACPEGKTWAVESCKTMAEVWDTCQLGDWMIWLLRREGSWTKADKVRVAVACASHVLTLYEEKYPKDDRPRKAIEAAQAWCEAPVEENAQKARASAYAAYAASDAAAYAAYAADADAAYAYAAYAAYAASAAYDASDADRVKERKWQADEMRRLIKNPFERQALGSGNERKF